MTVQLLPYTEEHAAWLRRVYDLFIYDLNDVGGTYQLDEQGVWQPDLIGYWMDSNQPVLVHLIQANGRNVGFSFVGHRDFPYKNADADFKISEFFLLREARGKGIGKQAVRQLLNDRQGKWELEVLHANKPALHFWQNVLKDARNRAQISREEDTLITFDVT